MADRPNKTGLGDGGPAFAALVVGPMDDVHLQSGMSLRDWFAGQAVPQVYAKMQSVKIEECERVAKLVGFSGSMEGLIAHMSYLLADAMIAARSIPPTSEEG